LQGPSTSEGIPLLIIRVAGQIVNANLRSLELRVRHPAPEAVLHPVPCCLTRECYRIGRCRWLRRSETPPRGGGRQPARRRVLLVRQEGTRDGGKVGTLVLVSHFPSAFVAGAVGMRPRRSLARLPKGSREECLAAQPMPRHCSPDPVGVAGQPYSCGIVTACSWKCPRWCSSLCNFRWAEVSFKRNRL
jgi:hypothetical protein